MPCNRTSYIVKRPWLAPPSSPAPPFSRSCSQWLRLLEMASSAPNSSSAPSSRLFQAFFTPSASYAPNPTSAFGPTSNSIHFSCNCPPGDSFPCFIQSPKPQNDATHAYSKLLFLLQKLTQYVGSALEAIARDNGAESHQWSVVTGNVCNEIQKAVYFIYKKLR